MTGVRTPVEEEQARLILDLERRMTAVERAQVGSTDAFLDGAYTKGVTVATKVETITSTGAYGVYAVFFTPVTFAVAPRVQLTPFLSSGSLFVEAVLAAITTTFFQFYMQAFNPGQVVVPTGQTVPLVWTAIGK